jgi:hypothetical protein
MIWHVLLSRRTPGERRSNTASLVGGEAHFRHLLEAMRISDFFFDLDRVAESTS